MTVRYQNVQEIEAVVAGFEDCTTSKDAFTHLSHLTVGAYYLQTSTQDIAFEKMRVGLFRFLLVLVDLPNVLSLIFSEK